MEKSNETVTVKTEVKNKITRVSTDALLSKESTENEKVLGVLRSSIEVMEEVFNVKKQTSFNRIAKVTKTILKEDENGKQPKISTPILEQAKDAWKILVKVKNKVKGFEIKNLKNAQTDIVKNFYEAIIEKYGQTISKTEYPEDLF